MIVSPFFCDIFRCFFIVTTAAVPMTVNYLNTEGLQYTAILSSALDAIL